jgi:hypothetical protein
MLDDNDAEQAVHDFRRRSVHLAPEGQFKKEADLDRLVDGVVADALGLAARGLARVEGEERLLEELQDLPEADRAEALLLFRKQAMLLTNPEDAMRLMQDLISEARTKSVLQRQQRQARRTSMGREARAQAVRDGIDEDTEEMVPEEEGAELGTSGKTWKARFSLFAGNALPAQLLEEIEDYRIEELGRTYPTSLRDKRLKAAKTGPRKEMAHAEAQADIKLARFHKNQQVSRPDTRSDRTRWEVAPGHQRRAVMLSRAMPAAGGHGAMGPDPHARDAAVRLGGGAHGEGSQAGQAAAAVHQAVGRDDVGDAGTTHGSTPEQPSVNPFYRAERCLSPVVFLHIVSNSSLCV